MSLSSCTITVFQHQLLGRNWREQIIILFQQGDTAEAGERYSALCAWFDCDCICKCTTYYIKFLGLQEVKSYSVVVTVCKIWCASILSRRQSWWSKCLGLLRRGYGIICSPETWKRCRSSWKGADIPGMSTSGSAHLQLRRSCRNEFAGCLDTWVWHHVLMQGWRLSPCNLLHQSVLYNLERYISVRRIAPDLKLAFRNTDTK